MTDPVRTRSGAVAGAVDNGVRVFRGIPYAAPPVGPLRWRPPQPAAAWSGVRSAERFGASAVQAQTGGFGPWSPEFIFRTPPDEDCLFLNVWTAAPSSRARRPVLVWIHGGAFTGGSGDCAVYDGAALARRGLVVVTVNYRLGALGFLAHPELSRESAHAASGNYGLLDQIAALGWVRDNIAAFGGDPGRVTLAGQSAGAASVHYLLASPLARGLFHRAIAQSGSGPGSGSADSRRVAEREGAALGSLASLRALPARDVLAIKGRFRPVVDGHCLTNDPAADMPILTGFTADEGSFSAAYQALPPERKAAERARGRESLAAWAARRAQSAGAPAFLYFFDRAIPWPEHPEFGAFHTGEVPYVFDNLSQLARPWEAADRKAAARAASYWVRFATAGDPNGRGLPRWPAFDPKRPALLRLNDAPSLW